MRSSIVLAAAFAAGALASPLGDLGRLLKRDTVTKYSYVIVTSYTTVDVEPTPAPKRVKTWNWRRPKTTQTEAPAAAATTFAPVVEDVPAAQPANTQAAEQQAPAPAATTQAAYQPPSQSTGNDYSDQVLRHHNVHRQNHSVPDLAWSGELASTALKIAKSCVYAHDT
jgi:uncharacterized protein YkwD